MVPIKYSPITNVCVKTGLNEENERDSHKPLSSLKPKDSVYTFGKLSGEEKM